MYDFLEKPEQTAVFRKPSGDKPGRFILLEREERVQTEISTDELDRHDEEASNLGRAAEAIRSCNLPPTRSSTKPSIATTASSCWPATWKLTRSRRSPTQHQDSLAEYREFLDWYTQLNTLLSAGNPPDPRLQLNDALARHKVVPVKVELKRAGEDPIRAEHDFTWRLSQEDLQRIDDVRTRCRRIKRWTMRNISAMTASQAVTK